MREVTVDLFSTVDGWLRGRDSAAYFGYDGPELQAWITEQLTHPYVTLMGANTYRALAHFAALGTADPASRRMDDVPKIVFSSTLETPLTWSNTTLIAEDAAVALPAMKEQPGDPMRVIGSLSLVRSLLRLGLVERVRLMLFPQLLGETGEERMFEGLPDINLRLISTRTLDQRLVLLEYAPEHIVTT
jgi:dihydrofolate reductase